MSGDFFAYMIFSRRDREYGISIFHATFYLLNSHTEFLFCEYPYILLFRAAEEQTIGIQYSFWLGFERLQWKNVWSIVCSLSISSFDI